MSESAAMMAGVSDEAHWLTAFQNARRVPPYTLGYLDDTVSPWLHVQGRQDSGTCRHALLFTRQRSSTWTNCARTSVTCALQLRRGLHLVRERERGEQRSRLAVGERAIGERTIHLTKPR